MVELAAVFEVDVDVRCEELVSIKGCLTSESADISHFAACKTTVKPILLVAEFSTSNLELRAWSTKVVGAYGVK